MKIDKIGNIPTDEWWMGGQLECAYCHTGFTLDWKDRRSLDTFKDGTARIMCPHCSEWVEFEPCGGNPDDLVNVPHNRPCRIDHTPDPVPPGSDSPEPNWLKKFGPWSRLSVKDRK